MDTNNPSCCQKKGSRGIVSGNVSDKYVEICGGHRDQRKRKCCKERVEPQLGGTRLMFVPPTGLVKRVISIIVSISAIIDNFIIIDIISAEKNKNL